MEAAALAAPPVGTIPEAVDPETPAPRPVTATAARTTAREMFKCSTYVHVGPGAEECPDEGRGCVNRAHFHAWCRLPNKFQHKDLHEKGMAAKARTLRRLRDPQSDLYAVLEGELADLRLHGDPDILIDDLLRAEWSTDYLKAMEETEALPQFEHINQDRERYQALIDIGEATKPEGEQSDEFRELVRHVGDYLDETKRQLTAIQAPKRQALHSLGLDGIVEQLGEKRIAQLADNAFAHVYGEWSWFIGTLDVELHPATSRPHKRRWPTLGSLDEQDPESMWGASPEVIEAIELAFRELELKLQEAASGNS